MSKKEETKNNKPSEELLKEEQKNRVEFIKAIQDLQDKYGMYLEIIPAKWSIPSKREFEERLKKEQEKTKKATEEVDKKE